MRKKPKRWKVIVAAPFIALMWLCWRAALGVGYFADVIDEVWESYWRET